MKNKVICVIGGDLRQVYAAEALAKDNQVFVIGFNSIDTKYTNFVSIDIDETNISADYILLPLPASENNVDILSPFSKMPIKAQSISKLLKPNGIIFGGKISDKLKSNIGIENIIDYYSREEMSVLNAVPTAEGAIQIALEELDVTLFGLNILIIGNGRISRALIQILKGFGANITVAARKYDSLAWAKIMGCNTVIINEIKNKIAQYDLIYNTAPARLLGENELINVRKDTLIIDLASKPGGVEYNIANELGLKTIWALSLPGKTAPKSSGKILIETIDNILCERRE